MNKSLIVEGSPHIKSPLTTEKIMLTVLIALSPTFVMSVYIFGYRAAVLTAICIATCMLSEYFFQVITKRENTLSDLSAIVTGVLLAFNLPVTLPYYMAVIGSIAAIVVAKQVFGGIGQNFANPAIFGRLILALSFTAEMNHFVKPFWYRSSIDAITSPTPLSVIAEKSEFAYSKMDLFLGFHGGTLGETCAVALLLGGIILVITKVISPFTPLTFIGTVAVMTFITGGSFNDIYIQIFSGGLVLGAIFMATDYATTPLTEKGRIIFALGCGLITFVIRNYASMNEGVSFSILLMNILTPYIDRFTVPKTFGQKSKGEKKNV